MATAASAIMGGIVEAIRATGLFELVTEGAFDGSSAAPRAAVLYESQEPFPSDDSANARWLRLKTAVVVHVRDNVASAGAARAAELCDACAAAIMLDPYRGGLCKDLPIGMATEVGAAELTNGLRRPEIEMTFPIRCHFERQEEP